MAKHNITYKCGCKSVIDLFGAVASRDGALARAAAKSCPECHAVEVAANRAVESAKASEASKAGGLPALEGSEKQVAWAETIRAEQAAKIEKTLSMMVNPTGNQVIAGMIAKVQDAANEILARTSAKEWIETRGESYGMEWARAKAK